MSRYAGLRYLNIPRNLFFAVRVPETQSVVYILCVQNLSERSALDAECLIREFRPNAVVVQVGSLSEFQCEESGLGDGESGSFPTSLFGVLTRCFIGKINKEAYEDVAGNMVLRENFWAAKRVAKDVGSSFMIIEASAVKNPVGNPAGEVNAGNKIQSSVNSLVPQKEGSVASSNSRTFYLTNDVQSQMVRLLCLNKDLLSLRLESPNSSFDSGSEKVLLKNSYPIPSFAQSIYPLLVNLHDIFVYLPSMTRALPLVQKMLFDVNRGEAVDTQLISEVYTFRIAVEGLKIALNNAGWLPMNKLRNSDSSNIDFSELSVEEKLHALLAQSLQSQARRFKPMAAVVDASYLAGLRKHWNTPVPDKIKDLIQAVTDCEDDGETSNNVNRKRLLSDKPVVAVVAGATAVLGVSSLSKILPTSTVMKLVTFKAPVPLKLILTQTQKAMAIALSKTKVVASGLLTSGSNTTSVLKAAASAEKIRTVTHSVIASVEKNSFSAMRTAFYEIMRKIRVRQIGVLPFATFGCSVATCTGLLVYGDGIECVAESLPDAPSIASLGRGIENLRQACQEVRKTERTRIQKSMENLMYGLKKA